MSVQESDLVPEVFQVLVQASEQVLAEILLLFLQASPLPKLWAHLWQILYLF
jgi:hypothetical protein